MKHRRAGIYWFGLTSITILIVLQHSGGYFSVCRDLTSVTFQETSSVKSIGQSAFAYSGLTSITIPNSVDNISSHVFYQCENLKIVTIPNTVESIANSVFYYCAGLESVIIPASVTNIEDNAFYECGNLSTAYFYGNAPDMGVGIYRREIRL